MHERGGIPQLDIYQIKFELSAKISAMFEIQPFTITYLVQIVKRLISK